MRRIEYLLIAILLFALAGFILSSSASDQGAGAASQLTVEQRVARLENAGSKFGVSAGAVSLLFGAFCALWAQNTRRNPWTWFFGGFLFNVVAIFMLLYKNAADVRNKQPL